LNLSDAINLILTGLLVGASIRNLKLLREHSSPKPFLKPTGFVANVVKPVITIKNYGPGHAINIKVMVRVQVDYFTDKEVKLEDIEYYGEEFIPFVAGNENKYDYVYKGNGDIAMAENTVVTISYESGSGYKMKSVWEKTQDGFRAIKL